MNGFSMVIAESQINDGLHSQMKKDSVRQTLSYGLIRILRRVRELFVKAGRPLRLFIRKFTLLPSFALKIVHI